MYPNAHQRLFIEGELNIYTAAEWKTRLDDLIAQGEDLELDLGRVQELDTAGLQLLIMAKKEANLRNRQLRLANHSPAVLEVFALCDLAVLFGDPVPLQSNRW
ncbi:anti-sigma B factor antagonist [Pseudomonas frederiksbergensis]|jgi:anti-anti-sigma factor|uniref:STAS domain-containing protein n=1 Tax=Pseudomonas frederiksbergensis TaxID=104087 RepID=UPI003D1E8079